MSLVRQAAERAATSQDLSFVVNEQDERPLEAEVVDEGGEALVQHLVQAERGLGGDAELVERGEFAELHLQLDVRGLQLGAVLDVRVVLLLGEGLLLLEPLLEAIAAPAGGR